MKKRHLVRIDAKPAADCRYVVRDNEVEPLRCQLRDRIFGQVLGFGSETNAHAASRQAREDVRVLCQLHHHLVRPNCLLHLLRGRVGRAEIGRRSRHNYSIRGDRRRL